MLLRRVVRTVVIFLVVLLATEVLGAVRAHNRPGPQTNESAHKQKDEVCLLIVGGAPPLEDHAPREQGYGLPLSGLRTPGDALGIAPCTRTGTPQPSTSQPRMRLQRCDLEPDPSVPELLLKAQLCFILFVILSARRCTPNVHYRVRRRLRKHIRAMDTAAARLPRKSPLADFRPSIRLSRGLRFVSLTVWLRWQIYSAASLVLQTYLVVFGSSLRGLIG